MRNNILIIDDDQINLNVFSYILRAFGYCVRTALSGLEGLELARKVVPDLIICDIRMPGMNGYQVLSELKTGPLFADTPVIAVTALAMVDDRSKMLQSGFDGYISKPIEPASFASQIAAFLREWRAAATEVVQ